MNPMILKYPLDRTGESPNNFVPGEVHELVDNGRDGLRVFVMNHGAFFTESLILRDANGIRLEPRSDFIATYLYEEESLLTGQEICEIIVITNPNVPSPVYADYQVLGGTNSFSTVALQSVLETLVQDDRPVEWANIVGKPSVYPASRHFHAIWELFGFEPVVTELVRIAEAIYVGDQAMHDSVRQYALDLHNDSIAHTDALDGRFQDHTANRLNPHGVTATQVGLGNVSNFATATAAEAQAGTRNDRFMTPLRVAQAIATQAGQLIDDHIADKTNPHAVTATQVGLGNVSNFSTATQPQAEAGTVNTAFMTPLRTAQAITALIGNNFQNHVNNTNNPHSVTAVQVGLGNVQDFGIASQAEAQAGTVSNKYMTPLRTAQAITTRAGTLVANHANLTNNPHNVTATQIGLSNVLNYGVSTQAEAIAGSVNNKYMTPLRTAQAIASQIGTAATNHIAARNNPHQVTAAQVGLGNVQNYRVASAEEARAGSSNVVYMTPATGWHQFDELFRQRTRNGFDMERSGGYSRLGFGAWATDNGFIEHIANDNASNSGDATMRFTVSDDPISSGGGNDRFEFGAGGQNGTDGWTAWATVNRDGFWSRSDIGAFSDGRYKENFESWEDPLALLTQLKGGCYDRTDIDLRQMGVIAQDLMEVLPEAVRYTEKEDRYSVLYGNLTAFLIEACKALLARVVTLEEMIHGTTH